MKQADSRTTRGLTMIEMLVVIGLVGLLAAILTAVIIQARRMSVQIECQEHLRYIGQTMTSLALHANGVVPPYLAPDPKDPNYPNNPANMLPWWVTVYRQWEGSVPIDLDPGTAGLQAPEQLPAMLKIFHCRAAAALSTIGATATDRGTALDLSISYGINFDVKRSPTGSQTPLTATPYSAAAGSSSLAVGPLTAGDMAADQYTITQIRKPSEFILLSEANTEGDASTWTGGRISMNAIDRSGLPGGVPDNPPRNAPIVGRHSGMANVLFADMHLEPMPAPFSLGAGGATPSVEENATNVNHTTRLWTLPDEP